MFSTNCVDGSQCYAGIETAPWFQLNPHLTWKGINSCFMFFVYFWNVFRSPTRRLELRTPSRAKGIWGNLSKTSVSKHQYWDFSAERPLMQRIIISFQKNPTKPVEENAGCGPFQYFLRYSGISCSTRRKHFGSEQSSTCTGCEWNSSIRLKWNKSRLGDIEGKVHVPEECQKSWQNMIRHEPHTW